MLFKHLRCFVAVVENGSFTRAAEQLYLTQSAVSQQISVLEAETGAELFYRQGRTIEPTASGRYLYREAKPLLEQLENTLDKVASVSTDKEPRLSLYYQGAAVDPLIVPVLEELKQSHPCLDIRLLRSKQTRDTLMSINLGEADIALLKKGPHPLAGLLRFHPIGYSHLTCALPKKHPLAAKSLVSGHDLAHERLVLLDDHSDPTSNQVVRNGLRYQWIHNSLRMQHSGECTLATDNVTALTLAKAGFGIALVDSSQAPADDKLTYVPFQENRFFEYGAFFHRHNANPYIGDFVAAVSKKYRGLVMFGPEGRTCSLPCFLEQHPGIEDTWTKPAESPNSST